MNDVSGVADQCNALGGERTGDKKSQWMNAPRADRSDVAEMKLEASFEFGMEGVIG